MEEWRPIPWYPDYAASSLGRIKRVTGDRGNAKAGRILKQHLDTSGYPIVKPYCKTTKVHKLIALAFIGERPSAHQVNHISGVKTDNTPDNLEYVTRARNIRHAMETGLARHPCGEKVANAKLNKGVVIEIRAMYGAFTLQQLADKFGVNQATVHRVVRKITWRHVA